MRSLLIGKAGTNIWRNIIGLFLGMAIIATNAAVGNESDNAAAGSATATIVCLHTEYLPYPRDQGEIQHRLIRELGRQAILIAAREELRLPTRDETLSEPFPVYITETGRDLGVKIRCNADCSARFALWQMSDSEDATSTLAPQKKASKRTSINRIIPTFTTTMEAMSRGEFADRLRQLGFASESHETRDQNSVPQSVEDLLMQMNFVSQYAAVRAAHGAIRQHGQTVEWLGVLARGYAHMALLTQHHWKSDNEVFAARALLYAERMVATDKKNPLSRAHRTYVWAVVGLHGAALKELKQVAKLLPQDSDSAALPRWFDFIEPFCTFDRATVLKIGQRRDNLAQLAARLSFEQNRAYDDRWCFESAQQALEVCPEDYSIYAALSLPNAPLAVGRIGAHYGPAALDQLLPKRVALLTDLPKAVQEALAGQDDEQSAQKQSGGNDAALGSGQAVTNVSTRVAHSLLTISNSGTDRAEPSWSVLGGVIAEDQFVQAANYLAISTNATESSLAEIVDAVRPTIKDHRYAPYLESYAVNSRRDVTKFLKVLGDVQFVDPRGNMRAMFGRTWSVPGKEKDSQRGEAAAWNAFWQSNMTMPGLAESYKAYGSTFWDHISKEHQRGWANMFRLTSPHSPQALRLAILVADEPTYEQVQSWEEKAGDDDAVYIMLADLYQKHERYEDAIRCYETSIDLCPTKKAFVGLAATYRANGQEEMWQPTLERFFEVESLGLEHASIHSLIAKDHISKGNWLEAEPHAIAAAETWSAWGLGLAADVTEALQKWEDSENWIREKSTSYPTSSGGEWYFWCRRHGRGDVVGARAVAQTYFSAEWIRGSGQGRHESLIFNTLENNFPAALEDAKFLVTMARKTDFPIDSRPYHEMMLALTAREASEKNSEETALTNLNAVVASLDDTHADLKYVDGFLCRLLAGEKPTDEEWESLGQHLAADSILETRRSSRHYILGRLCEYNNDTLRAQAHYKHSMSLSYHDPLMSTLSGNRLVMKADDTVKQNDLAK